MVAVIIRSTNHVAPRLSFAASVVLLSKYVERLALMIKYASRLQRLTFCSSTFSLLKKRDKRTLAFILKAELFVVCTRCILSDVIISKITATISAPRWHGSTVQLFAKKKTQENSSCIKVSVISLSGKKRSPWADEKGGRCKNEGGWNYADKHRIDVRCYRQCVLSTKTILPDRCPYNQIQSEHDREFFSATVLISHAMTFEFIIIREFIVHVLL